MFPVLREDGAPDSAHNAVDWREVVEQEPCRKTEGGRKDEKGEVRLCKGEVESNLRIISTCIPQLNALTIPSRPDGSESHPDPPPSRSKKYSIS